jgi:hypothetical protein
MKNILHKNKWSIIPWLQKGSTYATFVLLLYLCWSFQVFYYIIYALGLVNETNYNYSYKSIIYVTILGKALATFALLPQNN